MSGSLIGRGVSLVMVLTLGYACSNGSESASGSRPGSSGKSGAGGTTAGKSGAGKGGGGQAASGGSAGSSTSGSSGKAGKGGSGTGAGGTAGKGGGGTGGKGSGGTSAVGGTSGTSGGESGAGGMSEGGAGGSTGGTSAGHSGSSGSSSGGVSGGATGGVSGTAGTSGASGEAGTGAGKGGQGGEGGASVPVCDGGVDADGDGYGDGCPAGPDCNDFEPSIHPGAPEVCGNAFDDDCNPSTTDSCAVGCPPGGCGVGCADGTREAYKDTDTYPHIAGCDGGFSVPGVLHSDTPQCGRAAGNDSANANGDGCGATDLCAAGWHICRHPQEVAAHSPDGCTGSHDAANSFYVTRTSGSGCAACAVSTDASKICTAADCNTDCYPTDLETNDIFGCGTLGFSPDGSCAPLDRFSQNTCYALGAPWECNNSYNEALIVTKTGPEGGGVLCCSD